MNQDGPKLSHDNSKMFPKLPQDCPEETQGGHNYFYCYHCHFYGDCGFLAVAIGCWNLQKMKGYGTESVANLKEYRIF